MSEGIELPEHEEPEGHRMHPLTIPVSAVLLVAIYWIAYEGGHWTASLLQAKATDQWAYYQAKNIRLHEMQAVADMLGVLAPADKEKAAVVREKYVKEAERYEKDKNEISDKAKELEAERDLVSRRADRFDSGEVFLDMGLVICSITLLTKKRFFWFSGIAFGALGVILAATGFLLH